MPQFPDGTTHTASLPPGKHNMVKDIAMQPLQQRKKLIVRGLRGRDDAADGRSEGGEEGLVAESQDQHLVGFERRGSPLGQGQG
jgi:hypothetical protein